MSEKDYVSPTLSGWAFVEAALLKELERSSKAGEMFPQVADEQREDRRAFLRVIDCVRWAKGRGMPLSPESNAEALALREALREAQASEAAIRELMNCYNLGGWTDAEAAMKRALAAESRLASAGVDALEEAVKVVRAACVACRGSGAWLGEECQYCARPIAAIRALKPGQCPVEATPRPSRASELPPFDGVEWEDLKNPTLLHEIRRICFDDSLERGDRLQRIAARIDAALLPPTPEVTPKDSL